jgi:hypothetical protein
MTSEEPPGYSSSLGRRFEDLPDLVRAKLRRMCVDDRCGRSALDLIALEIRLDHEARELQDIRSRYDLNKETEMLTLRIGGHMFRLYIYPKMKPRVESEGWS